MTQRATNPASNLDAFKEPGVPPGLPLVSAKKQPQGPIDKSMRLFKLHSNGLEPLTFGSVDRCSIQLSYECPDVGTEECTRFFRNGKQVPDLIASCLF